MRYRHFIRVILLRNQLSGNIIYLYILCPVKRNRAAGYGVREQEIGGFRQNIFCTRGDIFHFKNGQGAAQFIGGYDVEFTI